MDAVFGRLRSSPTECSTGDWITAASCPAWDLEVLSRTITIDGREMRFLLRPYAAGKRELVWVRVECLADDLSAPPL